VAASTTADDYYLTMKYVKRFEPIESDPQILTRLMHRLGVQETFWFDDVLDYKEESQQPALALIAIFPESQSDEAEKAIVEAKRTPIITDNIKFLRQTIDNSCGLIAVLHCVLNTVARNSISKPQDLCVIFNEMTNLYKGTTPSFIMLSDPAMVLQHFLRSRKSWKLSIERL
jgi:hypothetical protein